jgi:hypothetical protein
MVAIGLRAFAMRADFVLYKVAMYIQPFLLGTAILSWFQLIAQGRLKRLTARLQQAVLFGPLAILIGSGLTAQAYYTQRSLGGIGGGFVEIPAASSSHLISQLIGLAHKIRPRAVISDTDNISLAKIESNYIMPAPLFCTTEDDFVGRFVQPAIPSTARAMFLNWMMPGLSARVRYIFQERSKRIRKLEFDTHGALPSADWFKVRTETADSELAHFTLLQTTIQGIVNRRNIPQTGGSVFRTLDLAQAHNLLLFSASEFGVPYYTTLENSFAGRVSMYQPENDYFYPQSTMVSMGRDSLFRIVNPSRKFRLALEFTASLNSDRQNRLPPISVIGTERSFLPVEGRGSARLFSPVIQPQKIGGGSYFLLDMGKSGFQFTTNRTGLMALYGKDIPLDLRHIVGFGRDISALSEQDYEDLAAPHDVRSFPADLLNKGLEYSGIYEDGWIAESTYLVLRQDVERSPLVVRLMVPILGGKPASSHMILLMDDFEVVRKSISSGESEFTIPAAGIGKHRIKMVFDKATSLPAPDGRPVSAIIRFIGFPGSLAEVRKAGSKSDPH